MLKHLLHAFFEKLRTVGESDLALPERLQQRNALAIDEG